MYICPSQSFARKQVKAQKLDEETRKLALLGAYRCHARELLVLSTPIYTGAERCIVDEEVGNACVFSCQISNCKEIRCAHMMLP